MNVCIECGSRLHKTRDCYEGKYEEEREARKIGYDKFKKIQKEKYGKKK